MFKRLMAVALLAVLCLTARPLAAFGADSFRATVVLPYYHVWKTDDSSADDRFTYRWTAETEGAPVPEGVKTSYWDWNLRGNKEGKLSMSFSFGVPGAYSYRLAAYVPKPKDGYTYEPRTYVLTILVQNAPGGGLQADWYLLNEQSGEKVDRIDLDPSYKGKKDSGGSGGSGSSGSGSGSSSGSSSGKKTGNTVRTGDDSRLRSWEAILSASFLMLVFLLFEDRRGRKNHREK